MIFVCLSFKYITGRLSEFLMPNKAHSEKIIKGGVKNDILLAKFYIRPGGTVGVLVG